MILIKFHYTYFLICYKLFNDRLCIARLQVKSILFNMNDKNISIPVFGFDNELTGLIVELERVREKFDHGTTSAPIFFELKSIFQLATSMTSARIEGNHTTVVDFVAAIND